MPKKLTKKVIGTCGVDAGMLMLVDPCYVQNVDAVARFDNWGDFLKASGMQKPDGTWPEYGIVPINAPGKPGHGLSVGVVVHTGDGDGEYPVTAYFDASGRCRKVEISFGPR